MKYTRVVVGCNDVATTHPEYVKYFLNKDDAYNVARWSEKRVDVICPDCGHIMPKRVCDLISYPFNCKKCGDKATYPNKYMYEFLSQLSQKYHFEIRPEHTFEWSKHLEDDGVSRRIYDFFLKYKEDEIIIEVHGGQHFDGSFCKYPGARTLEDELLNDAYKKDLALSNGISEDKYIVVDARKSTSDWIRSSIVNSKFIEVFPFQLDEINWQKCNEMACKSYVRVASDLWNDGIKSISLIGDKIGRASTTVIKYLKQANELGWCDYQPGYIRRFHRIPILCLDNNMAFESAHICSQFSEEVLGVSLQTDTLQNAACTHMRYRGYLFTYITKEEFNEHDKQCPNLTFKDEYFINQNNNNTKHF